jgi:hypothetical protein
MENKIIAHENWQDVPYRQMHDELWAARQGGTPPAGIHGSVDATINHGRWIVDCPNEGCGGAVSASLVTPEFYCTICGSPENGGGAYQVIFPSYRAALEQELIKRSARVPFSAENRNWTPGESLAAIKVENVAHGVT